MGSVVELQPEALVVEREREHTHAIGMMVALGSWAMMFAALFFIYFGLRGQALAWPPPGMGALPLALPALNTLIIILSSVTLARALRRVRDGASRPAVRWMTITFMLGLGFVGLQFVLWRSMWAQGITTASGTLGTVFYGLTVLHAIHVVAGLLVLSYLLALAFGRGQLRKRIITLRLCGMFWHFVGAVWVFMFFGLFLF